MKRQALIDFEHESDNIKGEIKVFHSNNDQRLKSWHSKIHLTLSLKLISKK
jgi:hypothetical protein